MTKPSARRDGILLMRATLRFSLVAAAPLALPFTGYGQQSDSHAPGVLVAFRVHEPVLLNGRLDESFWNQADSISDFRQREPSSGSPSSERTVVRVVRDEHAVYIGVHAYDSDPHAIRSTQLRRDADLDVDDNVTLLIDSFHDRRSGFYFGTNPNGAMWDAQFTGIDESNENWNGIWDVAARRDSTGWTAEFRIPFRTLRFRSGGGGAFGFNVQRFIRRKNETVLWRGWGRSEGLYRLNYAGDLLGFGDLRRGHDLEIKPYVLGQATADDHDALGHSLGGADATAKAGLDAKIALAPTVTGDLTVNTDFAQVEVDEQVINLTRLPTFFPEKREFFLESSGIFDFATPGRVQPFYSRRIGLRDDGAVVPIVAGARGYGKVGPWTLGLLDVETGHGDRANDLVLRAKHDLFQRSSIGAIAVQRSAEGGRPERVAGLDIDLPLVIGGRNLEPSFWIMGSDNPGVSGFPLAWRYGTDYPNDLFDNFVSLYRINAGFSPALGFVTRTGIWETTGHINFTPRPHVLGLRQLDLKLIPSWDIIADESGSLFHDRDWQTASFEWRPLGGDFQSGARFEVNVQRFFDAPPDSFEIFPNAIIPAGRYWWTRGELQYETSSAHPLSVEALLSWGDFYNGRNRTVEVQGEWRGGGHLILGTSLESNRVTLPRASFMATVVTGRLEYAFDTRASFLGFVQYGNEEQRIDFNLRFHWIPTIGDDIYVVWNSGYTTDPDVPHRFPSSRALQKPLNGALVVKGVHRFTF